MRNVKINLFEVGDIFLTVNNINPATRFAGTWELIAKGRTLVGVDPNDSDFNVVEKTGGSKYLQAHQHQFSVIKDYDNTNSLGDGAKACNNTGYNSGVNTSKTSGNILTSDGNSTLTTGNSGNLQPYFTCYIWCRTA